ncbi:glycine--tRNA ligase subunit beta [Sphingomicrobium flavum]|uniref:glycine--tRNA ligase subunit beta n=1 Tax=Sphingomicrobium flavum TaxID=1229164 RepID=UPI0021ADBA0A|nr:glycine--tRNA ligase subunit beta [Sphingomicrobium flavum]
MSDFLLELLSEEIPARMQAGARADLERLFAAQLAEHGLKAETIRTYSTPRRLALIATGLPEATEAVSEESKGPPEGAPDQAIDGFCRKLGISRDDLEVRDVKGRATYFAVVNRPGQKTAQILGPVIAAIIRDFPWPKSMRWGAASASSESLRWVRPLQRIVALLGEEIVPVEVAGVKSGAATLGHRFHHPGEITIGGAHDYADKLKMAKVLVDHEERETIVRDGAMKAATEAGYALVEDEGLVIENAGLTEWPVPLLGRFDPDFLHVPEEVIQKTARADQKYFVMRDGERLAPAFVCTANIDSSDPAAVVAGNERVLAARLSDARFFWENDLKVPLESLSAQLGDIVFHEKLGTVADKVDRVAKLARWLAEEKIVDADPDLVERAARLSKNDLVTGLVGEFGELQGIVGGHLARAQGEPDAVADAVRDHYRPVGQSDHVPTEPVTVAVSLADKLDTLVTFFAVNLKPTGSKDPFALRRASLGVLTLMTDRGLRTSLRNVISHALAVLRLKFLADVDVSDVPIYRDYGDRNYVLKAESGVFRFGYGDKTLLEWPDRTSPSLNIKEFVSATKEAESEIWEFLAERLKVQQREVGIRHDLIAAVFALDQEDDVVRILSRVKALQAFIETGEGADLLAGYKRASNILKKEEGSWSSDKVRADGDVEAAEATLLSALNVAEPRAAAALQAEDFTAAMAALASLRGPIDRFFEDVIVNADDAAVRQRRLALLARFRAAVDQVADFSKIEG